MYVLSVSMKRGFDAQKYINAQTTEIFKRLKKFEKLYLEIGGKLTYDNHASRVLPGYKKTTKIELIKELAPLEIIYCINAKDLESARTVSTKQISYQKQILKNLKDIQKYKLRVNYVAITRYTNEKKALAFKEVLEKGGYKVYLYEEITEYTTNIPRTLKKLFKRKYIPTEKGLTIITGPAGNSGKMSVALSQIYHEIKRGVKTGFAKYETFPIHNLPLVHPVNIAYEAATADLQDVNIIDSYHAKAYGKRAVNYNRDIENFGILQNILQKITGQRFPFGYKSPTDMGINTVKQGIIDDKICRKAATKEIKQRYKRYKSEYKKGRETIKTIKRMDELMRRVY